MYMADRLITGWIIVIGLAEAVHLAAAFLNRSFSDAVLWFEIGVTVLTLASTVFGIRHSSGRKKSDFHSTSLLAGLFLAFVLLVVWQLVTVMSTGNVYREGDMTAETVESFLATDGIYKVNPLTGQAYESGIPLRIRILCLPTLYGILCRIFGMGATEVVWKYVPLVVLCLSYSAFWILAKILFGGEKERDKRLLFMVCVAAIFCVGDYMYGMDGFGLLHCGFQGVTIRNTVLLPYVVGQALRRRWKAAVLCILAEACMVWTLYGVGACVLTALGMASVRVWRKRRIKGFPNVGEEA
jgi:hypothetical protein